MAQNLELRQSQSLVMTQRLQQSIKLLQLPAHELQEFIFAEVQANPLLTIAEPESDTPAPSNETGDEPESLLDADEESWWGAEKEEGSAISSYSDDGSASYSVTETIEQRHSGELGLKEHLRAQLGTLVDTPAERLIGQHLIDLLDDSGYLTEDTSSVQEMLGVDEGTVERVVWLLQRADPTGVFARSLSECLRLQMEESGPLNEKMAALFENLDMLGGGDLKKLCALCGMTQTQLQEAVGRLRTLNPKPGAAFEHEHVETLISDVLVRKGDERQWRVDLNPDALPKVLINREYHSELILKVRGKDEKKFVSEQFANANWLMKALDQRAVNTLKVAGEIVKRQKDFLDKGIMYLKPMRLVDIAEAVEVHESTVSRIVTAKTMATPRGLFELKYFFTTAVGGEQGEGGLSSRIIMHELSRLIAAELPANILSDDMLAVMLKDRGMDVARRTVVKYRQIMNIPSSVERRRAKASLRVM